MKQENIGYRIFSWLNILLMLILSAVMLFPYLNVLAKAFNDGTDTMLGGITVYPRSPTLQNFTTLLENPEIIRAAVISAARVILGTFMALLVQFSAAYAFTKKGLKGRGIMLIFLLVPMYFGGGLIPIYLLYSKLHLLNNFLVYILPCAFSLYNMIIIRTYLYTIPVSLEESAKLDGANEIVILLRIILPLSMPILATIALWTAVTHWNDWVTTLYYVTNSRIYTLQYILVQILRESERVAKLVEESIKAGQMITSQNLQKATPEAIQAAQIVITTLPIVILYPFLQKYFIKGVMIGAIKD